MLDMFKSVWRHKGKIILVGALLYAGLGVALGYHDYNRAFEIVTTAFTAAFVGG
jgi:predicted negative regulator of RcsB-dependent stress response